MLAEIPDAFYWSTEDVGEWIEALGYSQYRMCFITNGIDGKKLIQIDANALPKMGITKFEDIQIITASLRTILNLDPLQGNRSIRLPPRNATEMKLTGNPVADHSIPRFEREVENRIFATTMANMGYAFNYPETNPPVMDSHF